MVLTSAVGEHDEVGELHKVNWIRGSGRAKYDGKIAILCILCVVSCMSIYLSNKRKKANVVSL